MPRRVLVLGVTGTKKAVALENLFSWHQEVSGEPTPEVVDFESEFIDNILDYYDSPADVQRAIWNRSWERFLKDDASRADSDVFVSLHTVLTRPLYGVRSPISIDGLRDFRPTSIINLIDDAYTMWHRTETRAGGRDYRGRPTLEQLITARRTEIFLGDLLTHHMTNGNSVPHDVVAAFHPARVLHKLLFGPRRLNRIYLSFPISEPRVMSADGDRSGIDEVNAFLQRAMDFETKSHNSTCFCPLTIDEYPMINLVREVIDSEVVTLSLENRWNVRDFYGAEERLLTNDAAVPESIELRTDQVQEVSGMVKADVRTRDYRLVSQASRLAVFCPYFNGRSEPSRGVDSEIESAVDQHKPVDIYQDPRHDPEDLARRKYKRDPGALGQRPGHAYITFHDSLDSLFTALSSAPQT